MITPLPFGGGAGGGAAIFLTPVCFVLLCKSVRKNTPRHSYKTSNKGQCEAYIHSIGVSRWSLPFPSGEGPGEGPLSFWPLCVLFFCVLLWEKICHSPFVIMSFCLKKHTCLLLSLCHSVLKKTPVSLCHYVIMSKKSHLSSFVIMSFCLKKYICLPPSLCYSVFKTTPSVTPVLLCYPVFHTLSLSVLMLLCLKNHPICYLCLTLLPCLPYPVSPSLSVILS